MLTLAISIPLEGLSSERLAKLKGVEVSMETMALLDAGPEDTSTVAGVKTIELTTNPGVGSTAM